MKVCVLHYPNMYSPPVGVWWFPDDATTPDSYYLPGNDLLQVSGNLSMQNIQSGVQFATEAQNLADSTTYIEQWGLGYLTDKGDPPTILKAAQAQAKRDLAA